MGESWNDPQVPDGAVPAGDLPAPGEPPAAPPVAFAPPAPGVAPALVQLLAQTRPWVRFLGVLGFITTGLLALVTVVVLAVPGFPSGGGVPGGFKAILALVYLGVAGLHLPAAIFLNRYASRIRDLQAGGGGTHLEQALAAQKSFWRYVGILALVVVCLYALIFVIGLVAGIMAVALRRH